MSLKGLVTKDKATEVQHVVGLGTKKETYVNLQEAKPASVISRAGDPKTYLDLSDMLESDWNKIRNGLAIWLITIIAIHFIGTRAIDALDYRFSDLFIGVMFMSIGFFAWLFLWIVVLRYTMDAALSMMVLAAFFAVFGVLSTKVPIDIAQDITITAVGVLAGAFMAVPKIASGLETRSLLPTLRGVLFNLEAATGIDWDGDDFIGDPDENRSIVINRGGDNEQTTIMQPVQTEYRLDWPFPTDGKGNPKYTLREALDFFVTAKRFGPSRAKMVPQGKKYWIGTPQHGRSLSRSVYDELAKAFSERTMQVIEKDESNAWTFTLVEGKRQWTRGDILRKLQSKEVEVMV